MRLKILTVDDDPVLRRCVIASFRSYACDVLQAGDGLEALTIIERERPDLILLDFLMPVMDGSEMLAKLKSDPYLREIPVVVLTAEATRGRVIQLLQRGVRDYVLKPFRKEQLLERVGRIIELKPANPEGTRVRRIEDPLQLLLVEDKPAIIDQIRQALAGSKWTVRSVSQPGQALDQCVRSLPDVVLVSLSFPENAGFMLFQALQTSLVIEDIPIIGLSVKTAIQEQARARQLGFSAIVTKPIIAQNLRAEIVNVLHLDSSPEYFKVQEGTLVVTLPATPDRPVASDLSAQFPAKLAEAVDAGWNRVILDLTHVLKADEALIGLGHKIIEGCREAQIPCTVIGSDTVRSECKSHAETADWQFVKSFEEASALFNDKTPAMV